MSQGEGQLEGLWGDGKRVDMSLSHNRLKKPSKKPESSFSLTGSPQSFRVHGCRNQDRHLCEAVWGQRPCLSSASLGRGYRDTPRTLQSCTDCWKHKCTCSCSFWKSHTWTGSRAAAAKEALPGKTLRASLCTDPDQPGVNVVRVGGWLRTNKQMLRQIMHPHGYIVCHKPIGKDPASTA